MVSSAKIAPIIAPTETVQRSKELKPTQWVQAYTSYVALTNQDSLMSTTRPEAHVLHALQIKQQEQSYDCDLLSYSDRATTNLDTLLLTHTHTRALHTPHTKV